MIALVWWLSAKLAALHAWMDDVDAVINRETEMDA